MSNCFEKTGSVWDFLNTYINKTIFSRRNERVDYNILGFTKYNNIFQCLFKFLLSIFTGICLLKCKKM